MFQDWTQVEVLNPRGAWTLLASKRKGNPARASFAQNVRISPGVVRSREGTSSVFAASGKVTSMFNWVGPSNYVVYQEGSAIKSRKLSDSTTATLVSSLTTTRAASCADLGQRLYVAGYSTAGVGTTQARVYDGTNVDTAFRAPIQVTSIVAADSGAGLCTEGTHYIGFIYQSRSGFQGKPSPVNGSNVFTPASVTLNAGLRAINVTITLNTPADTPAGVEPAIYIIMTRADNPNKWFFVPGATAALPASQTGWITMISVDISDEDLAKAASADAYFDRLSQVVAGTGPFNPSYVVPYGKRMCYGAGSKIYISNPDDAQALTEADNVQRMPNQRNIAMAFPVTGTTDLFLTGDRWTGRITDTGDVPVTWAQPVPVSDAIGAPFPNCVCYRTAGGYAWVAAESGVYRFTGIYPDHAITYLWSDYWQRVNWAAAYAIQIADDIVNLKCYVAVPLDSATECTHTFVIDYTNGTSYDSCDITLDVYNSATFSSLAIVKDYSTARSDLWIGPPAAGNVVRLDETTHNDSGTKIQSIWRSGYARRGLPSKTVRLGRTDMWVRGDGTLLHTWRGLDASQVVTPVVMSAGCAILTDLSIAPEQEYQGRGDLHPVEDYTVQFETNAVDAWFELSGFRTYEKPGLWSR